MADDVWDLVNRATGEVGVPTVQPVRRRQHAYHVPGQFAWHVVSGTDYGNALRSLRGADVAVFAALPVLMLKDNWLMVRQRDVAEFTRLTQAAVSRGMARLRLEMVIGVVAGGLQFSPEIAWKGYARDQPAAQLAWSEAKAGWLAERKRRGGVV